MSPENEAALIAEDIHKLVTDMLDNVLGDIKADVRVYRFDAAVDLDTDIKAETAFEMVRHLRGGYDHDPDLPSDWHVRSFKRSSRVRDDGSKMPPQTTIILSQTFKAPEGYEEGATGHVDCIATRKGWTVLERSDQN